MASSLRKLDVMIMFLLLMLLPISGGAASDGISHKHVVGYAYSDTNQLVDLVERAARLLETEGDSAFTRFNVPGSEWFQGDTYMFAYALDGTCVFHAQTPDLMGRNLIDLKDINGKPVIRDIVAIGQRPEPDASGWVFYLWQQGTQLSPSWKSAYIRKVVTPNGRQYVLGSGAYNIKMERSFIRERVGLAVDYLESQGVEAAFAAFKDTSSPFLFLGSYIFVLDGNGKTLVDPAFPNLPGRDLRKFRDSAGTFPILEVISRLAHEDEVWVQYLWPLPGEAIPKRKVMYARKVQIAGKTMIVGSDYFMATPIWMHS